MANAFLQPPTERSTLERIAGGLAGFGAGFQGRGLEFQRGIREQRQEISDERKQAAAEDLRRARGLLDIGDLQGVHNLVTERAGMIEQLGGDPSETLALQQLTTASLQGDQNAFNALNAEVNAGLQSAADAGFVDLGTARAAPTTKAVLNTETDTIEFRTNQEIAADPVKFLPPPSADDDRALAIRERQVTVAELTETRQAERLSAASEGELIKSQDLVVSKQRSANSFDNLAAEFLASDASAGTTASISEFLKGALGTEDDVTDLRRRFNAIRASEAVNNLPPGPASDKDIALALSGFPKATTNPENIASFLRGSAKLARADAAWNQFKADFISRTGSPRNLNRSWREKLNSPALDDEVTMGEIYITAQNRNITPEEVMNQLGISQ